MRQYIKLITWVIPILLLWGCTKEARRRLEPTPVAIGSLNQLAIIADQSIWDGPMRDSLDFYFGSAFPILPQPESLFDLKHFTPEELNEQPTRKELKAYLILSDLSDKGSSTTALVSKDIGQEKVRRAKEDPSYSTNVGKDRWAKDQIIIYLFAHGQKRLTEQVVERFPTIAKVVQDHYKYQIDASTYLGGTNHLVVKAVRDRIGCDLNVPMGYRAVGVEEENTIWLTRETELGTSNIILHRLPYTSQDQFEKANIISLQDTLGRLLVSSSIENSYMRTNTEDLPILIQASQIDGAYAVELRGIWEMEGDFLAGPFISYLVLDEKNRDLILIEGFILAPGEKKRNQMLYLHHIMNSLKLEIPAEGN